MYQPRAKLEFVRRYVNPREGWRVFVDIDASEEGRTGGNAIRPEAVQRRAAMQQDAPLVRNQLRQLRVRVGGRRKDWFSELGFPGFAGDHDIVAIHPGRSQLVVAEVEADSSGQPEQKLYKAIGQIVRVAGLGSPRGWSRSLVLVVHGESLARHLQAAKALTKLGVSGLALANDKASDEWAFGGPTFGGREERSTFLSETGATRFSSR